MVGINNYTVYLHVFPDGKKYVGSTSQPVRERWDGGLGYEGQKRMFQAILKFGWENIRHYILFDSLGKEDAHLIEAALIRGWKTTMRGKGYNSVQPKIDGIDDFTVPEYKRMKIDDVYDDSLEVRRMRRSKNCSKESYKCKPVRLIETGEVFISATKAAHEMFVSPGAISRAAITGATCGTCWIEDKDDGWRMEVPAHWEYINTNTEEKDDSHDRN